MFTQGQTVHHFTNPDYTATVVDVIPPAYHGTDNWFGNWHDRAFYPGGTLLVLRSDTRTFRAPAMFWLSVEVR